MIKHIGITGHGWEVPAIHIEALNRFDFDSVLFPINPRMYANAEYRERAEKLLAICRERKVAVMAIKSVAKGPWADRAQATFNTWYEPFTVEDRIQEGVNFALSQPGVCGIPIAGDMSLQPKILAAAANFRPLSATEQEALIEKWGTLEPIFA
jgi:predicted aldo/keto reductase-like oxidoreductase